MELSTVEKIRIIAKRKNIELGVLAEKTGQTRQNLSNKMSHGDFRESELTKLVEALGCNLEIRIKDKDSGEEL